MILNKNICKKCYKRYGWDWNIENEDMWIKEGHVICLWNDFQYKLLPYSIHDSPLCECPYKLEHIGSDDDK